MTAPVLSLHHVTATADAAQADLDFYAGLLGLRLVKQTVNFDNPGVYHFYYGDELGRPGTIWTTFPYHGKGVPVGVHGAGQITATAFSVPVGSLEYWDGRLAARGAEATRPEPAFGEARIVITDPSGLTIELVETADDRPGWTHVEVGAGAAIRGLRSVTLTVRDPRRTEAFLMELLGLTVVAGEGEAVRLGAGSGRPGHTLDIRPAGAAPDARNGIGTVHHVALAVPDAATQTAIRSEVMRRGIPVTPVLDRQYFQSIYFREPGGVLLEIATIGPGFTVDETPDALGQTLKLPPWEEPNRTTIEATLPPITA
jgi:glyoxalase family protein